jgi:hypothetical protein
MIFRKLFALTAQRNIIEDLNFQDWNFTEYWKQFEGFSEKRTKNYMKYSMDITYRTEEPK